MRPAGFAIRAAAVALALAAELSCATAGSDFEQAERRDTIGAHEEFLRKHPDSRYSDAARRRLDELNRIWEAAEERRNKPLRDATASVAGYDPGRTTEECFRSDGWDARAPYYGQLGVVAFERKGPHTRYRMGTVQMENPSGIRGLRERQSELAESEFRAKASGKIDVRWLPRPDTRVLCELAFEDGILRSRSCGEVK